MQSAVRMRCRLQDDCERASRNLAALRIADFRAPALALYTCGVSFNIYIYIYIYVYIVFCCVLLLRAPPQFQPLDARGIATRSHARAGAHGA